MFAIAFDKPRSVENHGRNHVYTKAPNGSFKKSRQICFGNHASRGFGVLKAIPNIALSEL
jgi:hypothetical protein